MYPSERQKIGRGDGSAAIYGRPARINGKVLRVQAAVVRSVLRVGRGGLFPPRRRPWPAEKPELHQSVQRPEFTAQVLNQRRVGEWLPGDPLGQFSG